MLDYEKHRSNGLNVIAVGGDKLSRGLTLEGLIVSYFTRPTRMYDTLMQMGRWFGYRDGFIDVCRLYAPKSLVEWFEQTAVDSKFLTIQERIKIHEAGLYQAGGPHARGLHSPHHFVAIDVRKHDIQDNQVVIIALG